MNDYPFSDIALLNNGKKYGKGTMTYSNGANKYEGDWKDDKKNGQGTYIFPDGEKYEGEFNDDNFNGQGTYTFPDGEKYEGDWKDDKKND